MAVPSTPNRATVVVVVIIGIVVVSGGGGGIIIVIIIAVVRFRPCLACANALCSKRKEQSGGYTWRRSGFLAVADLFKRM